MSLLDVFQKKGFGLTQEDIDPRDVWEDEILAGEQDDIPSSFRTEGLTYEPQGAYPFCVSFAATTLAELWYERAVKGKKFAYSQPHLFFHSGGGKHGSGFRANLVTLLDKGAIPYQAYPMRDPKVGRGNTWFEEMSVEAQKIPFTDAMKIGGFIRVQSTADALKRAVIKYGGLLVGVAAGSGDYYTGNGKRVKEIDNHAVLLVGWTATHWIIFDSLWWAQKTGGYVTLDRSYTFPSAYAITSLPENWRDVRDEKRKEEWQNVLNHYGMKGNHALEVKTANDLLNAVQKANIAGVSAAAGRFWLVYVNAIAYGGYTITDVINDAYSWSKRGEHIFNFDAETREQWRKRLMSLK